MQSRLHNEVMSALNTNRGPARFRWTTAVVIAAAIVLGLIVFMYIWRLRSVSIAQIPFDSSEWLNCRNCTLDGFEEPTIRQMMLRDLIGNALPGLSQEEIEQKLGESPTHEEMRRHRMEDIRQRRRDEEGNYVRRGEGYYFDEYEWDLIYPIGAEQTFIWDHDWAFLDPPCERLIIRLDKEGRFESWYVYGSKRWPAIVGPKGAATYRRTR